MTDTSPGPVFGDVWHYPFLWSREAKRGETEVVLVPITSRPSADYRFAVEVPEIEKKQAGLDLHLPLWVIADEFNLDLPSRSFYFEPGGRIGAFSS